MRKFCASLALFLALLGCCGCTRNSEARIHVTNTGVLAIIVSLEYNSTTLQSGESDTLTMTWPGRGVYDVLLSYYPVGQGALLQYVSLELHHGDSLNLNLSFAN